MNATQARAALSRLFGKKAMWRYDESAPKAEERDAILAALPALSSTYESAKAAMEARRAELLRDPEYLRLREEFHRAAKERDAAESRSRHYRVTVGRSGGMFFHVVAQADNWQDAIDAAKAAAQKEKGA